MWSYIVLIALEKGEIGFPSWSSRSERKHSSIRPVGGKEIKSRKCTKPPCPCTGKMPRWKGCKQEDRRRNPGDFDYFDVKLTNGPLSTWAAVGVFMVHTPSTSCLEITPADSSTAQWSLQGGTRGRLSGAEVWKTHLKENPLSCWEEGAGWPCREVPPPSSPNAHGGEFTNTIPLWRQLGLNTPPQSASGFALQLFSIYFVPENLNCHTLKTLTRMIF